MPFPNIGPGELILILVIALIILGPGRLPDVAASLGKSVREFRKAATDVQEAASPNPTSTSTGQSAAPAASAPPAANRLEASAEPNRLTESTGTATPPAGGEQHQGSATS